MKRGITKAARVIYRAAFNGDDLPPKWRVSFVDQCVGEKRGPREGFFVVMTAVKYSPKARYGQCWWRRRTIEVLRPSIHPGWLRTLIHEFIHLRCRRLRHGPEFDRLIAAALARVWA